jgi:phosphoglycolate phosphatase
MKYKAILFDLDGTLLDTLEDLANSMNSVLSSLGFPTHEVSRYKGFVGEGVEYLAYCALPENHRGQEMVSRCMALMREAYRERWAEKTCSYPGIPELLDELSRQGIKMAILSNKPDDFTQLIVAKFLSRWKFQCVMGAQDSLPKKPDPTAALKISKRLGLVPGDFLYLGDTKIDMKTAADAGMYPVGALWGFRSQEELLENGARILIKHPTDLLNLI